MATPQGAVPFEAEGRARTLLFTTNRICLLEEKLGRTTLDIAAELGTNPPLSTIRAMYWAGIDDGAMTLDQAGQLIDAIGRQKAIRLVKEAFFASFPEIDEDDRGAEDGDRPPVAAAG